MIIRIKNFHPMDGNRLFVSFDDGREVVYDMNEDIDTLPGYSVLKETTGLFQQAMLDESRTCIYWNDEIDLPSDEIAEYGEPVGS